MVYQCIVELMFYRVLQDGWAIFWQLSITLLVYVLYCTYVCMQLRDIVSQAIISSIHQMANSSDDLWMIGCELWPLSLQALFTATQHTKFCLFPFENQQEIMLAFVLSHHIFVGIFLKNGQENFHGVAVEKQS